MLSRFALGAGGLGGGISYLGAITYTAQSASGGSTQSLASLSLQQNDFLLLFAFNSQDVDLTGGTNLGTTDAGWTLVSDLYANDTNDSNMAFQWQRCGATPPTTVLIKRGSATDHSVAAIVMAFRGVNTTTGLDVTTTTATGTNGNQADPASITPVTAGAWVVAAYGGSGEDVSTSLLGLKTSPSNMTQREFIGYDEGGLIGTQNYLGVSTYAWTSGAFNPNAVTGTGSTTSDSWAAVTVALRPA